MRVIALGLLLTLGACVDIDDPPLETTQQRLVVDASPRGSAWILHPQTLDEEHWGTSNCSPHVEEDPRIFAFGAATGCGIEVQHVPTWACFERKTGHDGWIRQQAQSLHCDHAPRCGGGPADLTGIRLCRDPGTGTPGSWPPQESPCGPTFTDGCAVCVFSIDCNH